MRLLNIYLNFCPDNYNMSSLHYTNPTTLLNKQKGYWRMYSQTWANDQLQIVTTCPQRPPFWGPIFTFYNTKLPLTTTTCQQRPQIKRPEDGRCTQVWLFFFHSETKLK